MKIADVKSLEVEQLATKQAEVVGTAQAAPLREEAGANEDVIQLSPQSRLLQKASAVVYQAPEVRPEKVAALQEPVQKGTYVVDSKKVANSLIAELIQEK
jgi:negative regulator of flagellin synthesis FlgM|uniref:Negative regulator of flagellin synthesis n=1 Tax=Desulfobacca acetoxidans TaxID=60893 RepID=A0A7C3UY40_9BACT